ncbi:MAG TPA: sensor histidine kinase [Phototrophicaceae bacterium]|nr:sensor histidine kinase [Phototrophicaceae bacterium]
MSDTQFAALADHLLARREAILENWRCAVDGDPSLSTATALAQKEFYDHIPAVLDAFDEILRARNPAQKTEAAAEQKSRASEHGLHRWHHGYNQKDVMREWSHLQLCLLDELENYSLRISGTEPDALPTARRALAQLCSDGMMESAARYAELQQLEAIGRIRDLENAIEQLTKLDQQRRAILRRAVHDVRNSFGVIKNISDQLGDDETDESAKTEYFSLLQKSVGSLHTLLNNLLVLTRLEAGQERRDLRPLDAALLLKELCDSFQSFAADRGLFLQCDGPPSLPVQGDAINLQRIAQNLVLNALKYTACGGVNVTWNAFEVEGRQRWALTISDTGPGFQNAAAAPLAGAIEESTAEAKAVEHPSEQTEVRDESGSSGVSDVARAPEPAGEGIGLAIVKRLCELLDATLELESEPGRGSVFRVELPRYYPAD